MIKINLLPQRKSRRQSEPGQLEIGAVMAGMLAAAALTYVLVHRPAAATRDAALAQAQEQNDKNARLRKKLVDLPQLKAAVEAEQKRKASIEQLVATTVLPDNVLRELASILTAEGPTMTQAMSELTATDPNRGFTSDWDPKHVWLTSFSTKADAFTLEGGAQAESDVPQLAKRMAASVYFYDVTSPKSERVESGGLNGQPVTAYTKFTVSGKVRF
ncbi:MAG: PilN domain-containing protein [Kofleriaceae bacterium]